ncbi:glycosyl hydrolase family 3 N terminal domain-containing protein [Dactylonectria macrodidyma]|uniref:beta-glucosidase n=1 Tax=Dactylonectria macrodidyma TaxID=307937 RepID=A0A9P9FQL8_9HYPO|nr:glycosyl hydrolase family 3 N terminal domain-containing protein [Dactylonectria macrodidyma]
MQSTLALTLLSLALAPLARSQTDAQFLIQVAARDDNLAHSPPHYPSPWMDPAAPGWEDAYIRARDFVSQLTLLEKVNLTTGVGWMSERCVGNVGSIPRLGMRGLCMQDGPLGLRLSDYNSAFPGAITAGASWSRELWHERGLFMGTEANEKGIDVLLGPASGPLGRAPTGGRNWEGFTVDPYMAGIALAETSSGIQEGGVIATAKHYIGNEQEHFRQAPEAVGYGFNITESLSSNIDDKTLHELYAWPFADAVRAGVGAIMCSYQQVNNSYGCQNSKILNGILKDELGFQGFVMSDWQAQHAGAATAAAGLDMTMPGDTTFTSGLSFWGANLTLAVINGTVPEWRIDDMAMRIMASFFKVGRSVETMPDINFSSWTRDTFGYVQIAAQENWEQINFGVDVRHDHGQHIREAAAKGSVLLKNTGSLPLNKPKFVAVIGEDAGPNPAGPNGCSDRGCDDGTLAMAWGSGTSQFSYLVTPDSALQFQAIEDGTRYESILNNNRWAQVSQLVSQPNVTAIVFANADSGEGYINVDGNEGDRKNLTLWKNGDDLIKNVSSICPNTIVVLHTVGPVLLTEWYDNPNITAIVWAGLPGQESGNSITDILYGKTSPGRSPFTWGRTRKSYGTDVLYEPNNGEDAPQHEFSEGVFIDYRHFDRNSPSTDGTASTDSAAPIYEFGFGLSWSTFEYSSLQIQPHIDTAYEPTSGETIAAPELGNFSTDLSDYTFPSDIRQIRQFIYPWLNTSSSGREASLDPYYGQTAEEFLPPNAINGSPQPKHPAGGAPGGNPQLWDVLYTVSATVTNTGNATSDEVAQLYISLGGENEPVRVLRGFERLENVAAGQSIIFTADITRRDLSNWDVATQNWVITEHEKTVYVGSSSRNLPLNAVLDQGYGKL